MRRRSDILGSLHNRTLHILMRQLPLFINQRGTLQLSAKVVSTGDKYFFSTENAKCWPFFGPFWVILLQISALFGVLFKVLFTKIDKHKV